MSKSELETARPDPDQTGEEAEPPARGVSRRELIAAGAAAGAALVLPGGVFAQAADEHVHSIPTAEAPPHVGRALSVDTLGALPRTFAQPRTYMPDSSGIVDVTLDVAMTPVQLIQQNTNGGYVLVNGTVRAFNHQVPGPTIVVDPGNTLAVQLVNNLPPNPAPPVTIDGTTYQIDACNDPDAAAKGLPHCFNTINLHTHGLHVSPMSVCQDGSVCSGHDASGKSPKYGSDDVAIEVQPGQQQAYRIVLPDFHAPGTHWYHTHKHGATAIGVMNGLAGALIVREPVGQEVIAEDHADLVWLIQEVLASGSDQLVYTKAEQASTFLVNGVFQPTITVSTGEVQRWRMINATARPRGNGTIALNSGGCSDDGVAQTMNLIAVDGILFYGKAPMKVTQWEMAPGNRADFLVQFSTAGTYSLCFTGNGGTQLLATVNVVAGTRVMTMPKMIADHRPCYLDPITAVDKSGTEVKLQMVNLNQWSTVCPGVPAPSPPPQPLLQAYLVVNCQRYDHSRIDESMTLNTAEEWTISNGGGAPHPFHIHVNPFLVVEINDGSTTTPIPPSQQLWWDSFAVPSGGYIKIRHRFTTYYGKFVDHCHFLNHEDLGMMQNVEVVDDGKGVGPNTPVKVCARGKN